MKNLTISILLISLATHLNLSIADSREAADKLRKVVSFYRSQVGFEGAYLWRYSADLNHQEGEGIATKTSGWTQPPGAPSVGEAYLKAWRQSRDSVCLDAAIETANALVSSQLISGGWSSHFDLGPDGAKRYAYRKGGKSSGRNLTTFDDNKSQSALLFLMHVDEELEFQNPEIHEAVEYALSHMLAAQYPNGAWPQQFAEPPDAALHSVKKASYPDTWSRVYTKTRYVSFYTLNDNNMSHIVDMFLEANRIYQRTDCYEAAVRTGDFFLLAQMPEPQPGWAQQYNAEMHPAWARKFEPPAITGGESQSVLKTLLRLYRFTAEKRFLEPIPTAVAYYNGSALPDGQLARFYELKTNKPLFFTKDYKLTYSDADVPTHYSFKSRSNMARIERDYQKLLKTDSKSLKPKHSIAGPVKLTDRLQSEVGKVIDALDSRGAWTEKGRMRHTAKELTVIDMRTFIRNLDKLSQLAGAKE